jgi:hypothetical protein
MMRALKGIVKAIIGGESGIESGIIDEALREMT